jgi:hypothetical protein
LVLLVSQLFPDFNGFEIVMLTVEDKHKMAEYTVCHYYILQKNKRGLPSLL